MPEKTSGLCLGLSVMARPAGKAAALSPSPRPGASGLALEGLHEPGFDGSETFGVEHFMAEDVADIEHVHCELAVGGDDGRRDAEPHIEQGPRDLVEQADAVKALDLDHGGDGR